MLCRLCCLNKDSVSPIFDSDGHNFGELIKSVLPCLRVIENDCKPQHICIECGNKLRYFKEFVQQCLESECMLNSIEDVVNPQSCMETNLVEGDQVFCELLAPKSNDVDSEENSKGEEPQYYLQLLVAHEESAPSPQDGFVPLTSLDPEFVIQSIASQSSIEEIQSDLSTQNTSHISVEEVSNIVEHVEQDKLERLLIDSDVPVSTKKQSTVTDIKGKKKIECEICGRGFTRQTRLNAHMLLHSNYRPYKCDICEKGFCQAWMLSEHLKIHRGDFKCEFCCRVFLSKTKLARHKRIHSTERPFPCSVCEKSFTGKENVVKHMRLVHSFLKEERRPFLCSFCSSAFSDRSTLRDHYELVHGGSTRRYDCPAEGCPKRFKWRTNLNRHMKKCSLVGYEVPAEA